MTRTVTDEQLAEWLDFAQQVSDFDYKNFMPYRMDMAPVLVFDDITGKTKYVRIITTDDRRAQRSVWGFINLENGDVLKADGWKKPALNFTRGNIFDNAHGLERARWTGVS